MLVDVSPISHCNVSFWDITKESIVFSVIFFFRFSFIVCAGNVPYFSEWYIFNTSCRRYSKLPVYVYHITRIGSASHKRKEIKKSFIFILQNKLFGPKIPELIRITREHKVHSGKKRLLGNSERKSGFAERKAALHVGFFCSDIFCASIDWEQYWDAKLSLSLNKFLILATMWTNANLKGTNK